MKSLTAPDPAQVTPGQKTLATIGGAVQTLKSSKHTDE